MDIKKPMLDPKVRDLPPEKAVELYREHVKEQEAYSTALEMEVKRLGEDYLTGLFLKPKFYKLAGSEVARVKRRIERGENAAVSVIYIDLDDFKQYNDSFGHIEGDRLLNQVGRQISANIREPDTAFRMGGEEFAVLVPDDDLKHTVLLAERMRVAIPEKLVSGEPVTISFGVSTYPFPGIDTAGDLAEYADMALYHAKALGRNRVVSIEDLPENSRPRKNGRH
jgi:two-component system cell cycle response regulator